MPGTCLQLEPATSKCSPSPVRGYSSWTVGSPKTFCPNICLDLWKPCSPQHNHPDSFPRNYRVFSNRSATGSLTTHSLLTQLACDWLAGFQPLSLQGMTDKGCPAKKISSFPKQNASLCDSLHPPRVNCWAFPLVPAGSQAPKLSTTTLHDGAPLTFGAPQGPPCRQAKKFCPKVDTVLKNPDIYYFKFIHTWTLSLMILILKNLRASLSMKLLTMLYVIKITIILRHKCTMPYKHASINR